AILVRPMLTIDEVMRAGAVIPVLVIDDAAHAAPLAKALVAGGLPCLEVTLRTPQALDAIREMRAIPGAIVGAGTVLNARQYDAAVAAGAQFIVSPGLTEDLAEAARNAAAPLLPGIATASEIMRGLDLGLTRFKFFPAETSGGAAAVKAFAGPFADVRFCPTGGVTPANAGAYFAAGNVACVGGSWLAPKDALAGGDWARIEALARAAAALRP
ncbi:MAG: bifunctional 4-hydroxy-2-oxoglutarate aldolase/2-dehydro-3-deoxy-phosphogluconate aldolase, partial [Hyphomonadaceae bacterium]|nr:bifunctional 4-hydroxy-2-oxoglutarate aldolase/2-dehydro-3-deoxy-phosphogluconate aldolase [Hyphomonadaceae bacterium]